ncbi:alpha/beta hydrolase [Actinomycetospora sp. OC33-EN08]|uniref:Alpha/beta hydrolase n=1 Tax=Actinomycetospora aurantiaca TaxID=3129233 RepID=A0ABU8MNX6_9PSEU
MPHLDDVVSADGTRIRWWDNGCTGRPAPDVVISNGLGASPAAWPWLGGDGRPSSDAPRAVTWHHRGLGGSERPADPDRITIGDHVDDLFAVMDAAGIASAAVVGWSVGVAVAFEAARRAPERVSSLLVLGGVAGGGFRGGPSWMPGVVSRGISTASAWSLRLVGPPVAGLISLLPRSLDAGAAAPVGVFVPPPLQTLAEVAREFSHHDWTWFSRMVLAAGREPAIDVSGIRVPTTVVAGEFDTMAPVEDMVALADAVPGARLVRVPGTHFVPLQFPDLLAAELDALRSA